MQADTKNARTITNKQISSNNDVLRVYAFYHSEGVVHNRTNKETKPLQNTVISY